MKLPLIKSIGARANIAFSILSLVMMVTLILSWLALEKLATQINEIHEVRVPSLSKSVNMLTLADNFENLGSELANAANVIERERVYEKVSTSLKRMQMLNSELKLADHNEHDLATVDNLIESLKTELSLINSSAIYQLQLQENAQQVSIAFDENYESIKAVISDSASQGDRDEESLLIYRSSQHLFGLAYRMQLLIGLTYQMQFQTTLDDLSGLKSEFQAALDNYQWRLEEGTGNAQTVTTMFSSQLDAGYRLLSIREQQLKNASDTAQAIDRLRVQINQTKLLLALNIKVNENAVSASSEEAKQLVSSGTTKLALSVAAVVLFSFFAGFVFVRRSLIRRLTNLATSMEEISKGHLDTPIDHSGDDEITRMAKALRIFRDTARDVETQQTKALIESSVAGLVMSNAEGDIEFLSSTARKLLGYENIENGEPTQLHITDFVTKSQQAELQQMLEYCHQALNQDPAKSTRSDVHEFEIQCRDGRLFPGDIAVRGIQQRIGQKFIFTIYDVTERKSAQETLEATVKVRTEDLSRANVELREEIATRIRAEQTLRSTREELIQASKLAALGKMAAGISHELNQPLTAVASWIHNTEELLRQNKIHEVAEALHNMDIQVNRMIELASHLRVLARQPDLAFTHVDVGDIVTRAISLFSVRQQLDDITIVNKIEVDSLKIVSDPLRLEQIIINLLANAFDAVKGCAARKITLHATENIDETITLNVADTGPGIPDNIRAHLFDPFFTTKEIGSGMGLGLSISYNITRNLGGTLSVDEDYQAGACFTLILPRVSTQQSAPVQAEKIW